MSENVNDKELELVTGGDDPNRPLYKRGDWYEAVHPHISSWDCTVSVEEYDGYRDGQNYYKVKYFHRIPHKLDTRYTTLSETDISNKKYIPI